ncbi:MAG TPA: hypothetical protein VF844_02550 [Ktedonobacteraceae bacterium]
MNKDSYLNSGEALDEHSPPGDEENEQDLVLLRYMTQKIYITLYLLDDPADPSQPLLYYLEEGHKYTHRIAIYNPRELLLSNKLDFVGFISRKLQPEDAQVIEEIRAIDKKLIVELINTPGLMSYSSLELRDGRWCNLVVFSGPELKAHLKHSETHAYAAYQLSPRYYDWVRLHNGVMPGGLARNQMLLRKTTYYRFHGPHEKPTIQESTYEA